MAWPVWAKTLVKRASITWALISRPVVLGVRILARDDAGRIVLVRHRYLPGWYLPGGAVDPGETAAEGAIRELREETGCVATDAPALVGLYLNARVSRRDHVALFRLEGVAQPEIAKRPDLEIVEVGWFAPDELPEDTTGATRRRIAEVLQGEVPTPLW